MRASLHKYRITHFIFGHICYGIKSDLLFCSIVAVLRHKHTSICFIDVDR